MKKMMKNYFWMMGLMLCGLVAFSSCERDPDEDIGYDVRGHWFGDLDMWIDGEKAQGSEIEFIPTGWGYTYGRGVEVDYYRRGRMVHDFDYRIRDGIIFLTFDDPNLDCAIVDYRLGYNYFSGYIADSRTLQNQTYFNLRNYDRYWDDYGYGGYYYVKGEKSWQQDSIASNDKQEEPYCIRGINKMKE